MNVANIVNYLWTSCGITAFFVVIVAFFFILTSKRARELYKLKTNNKK